jgi:phosphoglycerate dehydrogenase-like enzyme
LPARIAVLITETLRDRIFSSECWERLNSLGEVVMAARGDDLTAEAVRDALAGARVCITGWGTPALNAQTLSRANSLGLMAHSAGTVKPLVSDALWDRGIRVTSGANAAAGDVAWTTVAMMVLARKNVFLLREHLREGKWGQLPGWPGGELYGSVIGIVGASHVGRQVMRILDGVGARILLYDPCVASEEAGRLGADKLESLESLIRDSDIVSVHAPSLPETRHMFNAANLALLRDGSVFINTARGALVDEQALIEVLRTRRVFACIDVTDPEPPAPDSPLRTLPNVLLTPHLAGMVGSGLKQLGEAVTEEVRRFLAGEPLVNEVTREMLPRLA